MSSPYDYVVGRQSFDARDIARIFPPACSSGSRFMTAETADDLRSWLIEPDHAAERRERLPLDPNQRDLASTRTASGYRRIRGPAGSGKSAVLAARAARLSTRASAGHPLVVSYNITLLHYLRDLCSRAGSGDCNDITWINFHALCKRLAFVLGSRVPTTQSGRTISNWASTHSSIFRRCCLMPSRRRRCLSDRTTRSWSTRGRTSTRRGGNC